MMSKCRNESEKMTDADWHKYNFEIWLFSCQNVKENLSSVFSKSSLCISDLPCEQVHMYVIYQKVYIIYVPLYQLQPQPRKQKNCQLIDDGYHDEIKSQSEADVNRSAPRSPVPGSYFGHYEQYFRSRYLPTIKASRYQGIKVLPVTNKTHQWTKDLLTTSFANWWSSYNAW